jgi:hypothetical protein
MNIDDKYLLDACLGKIQTFLKSEERKIGIPKKLTYHPIDADIIEELQRILTNLGNRNDLYFHVDDVKSLWGLLLEKAIKCLRFFDKREPYQHEDKDKEPVAYGIEDLKRYYDKYCDFEGLLYGSSRFYRDHVLHAFRTWLLGIYILISYRMEEQKEKLLIDCLEIEGSSIRQIDEESKGIKGDKIYSINYLEKVSMWTVASLCHDLGYPLEKTQRIFDKTKEMMQFFISNPEIHSDQSFRGVQNYINDYIVKLMSTRMVFKASEKANESKYFGRIQPKYYIKFSKSLEKYYHGVISAIILFKSLVYFLESDFNLNEDYQFTGDEAKQFNIRREILRAMAAHTCDDIYHIQPTTLSFLLTFCDELQEWDRKYFRDLYLGDKGDGRRIELKNFSSSHIDVFETVEDIQIENIKDLIKRFYEQFEHYKKIFRDGQDTDKRTFDFKKTFDISITKTKKISLLINIPKDKKSNFQVSPISLSNQEKDKINTILGEIDISVRLG